MVRGTEPAGVLALLAAYHSCALSPRLVATKAREQAIASGRPEWTSCVAEEHLEAQLAELSALSIQTAPLYGIPFGVKDNIDVLGVETTAACPEFAYMPQKNSTVVERLMHAGAIYIGKTNLDQFATGLVGTRSPYGDVKNTFDPDYVSGGSSSGSATVVARGVVSFALGTDTAGSGRVPATFNNIVGLKPTPGRVSTSGVVPACRSLDCVSVFALSAADAARVLSVIEGEDDDYAGPPSVLGPEMFTGHADHMLNNLPPRVRVGIPSSLVFHCQRDYVEAFETTCKNMSTRLHIDIVPIDFSPLMDVASLLYGGPWVAERYAAVGSFIEQHVNAVDPVVRDLILDAAKVTASDAFRGQYTLASLAKRLTCLWRDLDLLLVPSAPCHPTISSVKDEPVLRNSQLGTYTNFVNLLGWSALAMPAALLWAGRSTPLPFGITMIAPGGFDVALLNFGAKWQKTIQDEVGFGAIPLGTVHVAVEMLGDEAPRPQSLPALGLAVVGAHLAGMPLHWQLVERSAHFLRAARTSPQYRLYHLQNSTPPKPGLMRVCDKGISIEVEMYSIPENMIGSLLKLIPHPLGLGTIELEDGEWVHGFICESDGIFGAKDVSDHGSWRAYMASLEPERGGFGGPDDTNVVTN